MCKNGGDQRGNGGEQRGFGALDAVEGHDAVLERNFELRFGFLHLLLADIGLKREAVRLQRDMRMSRAITNMQAVYGV